MYVGGRRRLSNREVPSFLYLCSSGLMQASFVRVGCTYFEQGVEKGDIIQYDYHLSAISQPFYNLNPLPLQPRRGWGGSSV